MVEIQTNTTSNFIHSYFLTISGVMKHGKNKTTILKIYIIQVVAKTLSNFYDNKKTIVVNAFNHQYSNR